MKRRPSPDRPLREFAAATALAFALTWTAFAPALDAGFVSDDVNAIVENEWVMGDFDAAGIVTSFSWWGQGRADSPGYRPAATLSFALSRLAGGDDPRGFRLVNFVLNALCAGLLFSFARRLGLGREAAGAAAGLFAVLPLHSEAVVWVVGRAELGAAAGFLAAALACLLHRRSGSIGALAAAAAAVVVGTAFKENAVTVLAVPAVFAVALRRDGRPWQRDAAAFAALAAGLAAYALLRWTAAGPPIAAEPGSLLDNPLSVVDAGTRLLGALAVLGRYLSLMVWPASLSVDYSWNALGIGPGFRANADTAVALAFFAVVAWLLRRAPGRRDVAAVGLLLAAASWSIVSNTVFVIGTMLGERLFYLPSAGLCLAAAAVAEPALSSPALRSRMAAIVMVLAVAAVAVDRRRSLDWLTPVSLFEAAVAAAPRSARAHMELASAYGYAGRIDDAERHFAAALEILPDYAAAAYNRGNTFARAGRYDEAAGAYRRALEIDPLLTRAWHNLALTHRLRGRKDESLEAMRGAVRTSPGNLKLKAELAEALVMGGLHREAAAVYDELVAAGAGGATLFFNRGVARHNLSGCADAVEDYRRAAAEPGAPRETFAAAAGCLKQLGRDKEARALEEDAKVANRGTRR
ncbi:MAG: tetratricopeptide repeat protein [Candidatus Binatia bacterium]